MSLRRKQNSKLNIKRELIKQQTEQDSNTTQLTPPSRVMPSTLTLLEGGNTRPGWGILTSPASELMENI